ncbi:merozoite surface protein 1 [Anthonomus grandis grandis]|uniref:merozoite surface protein 1 n=1 Tax=Anthonomus grandis grandis TaxID=2921223 RepID=UPI0021667BE4|nr:merozoite surface protein 1 [Anthonomus grandis grandis]
MNEEDTIKLTELNKKITEIKKKIQLSEGQRKALFEDCETERKSNSDEILKLKKEVSNLVILLHESKSPVAKYRLKNRRVAEIVGPLTDKTCPEVKELLDLQIIDLCKKLDLLRYRIKKRRQYIVELGTQYQKMVSQTEKKELAQKVERPMKKSASELQNNIHAVEVQIREAVHIRNKYADIRKSLKEDAAKFESRIKTLEEELQMQAGDIDKLQKIMEEATKRRGKARGHLLKEERQAASTAVQREKEADEGRRLVSERKVELEKLEKRLFISGRLPVRPEPEGAEADAEEEKSSTPPHPVEIKSQEFELLKRATGGSSTQEVLERFEAQREALNKLNELRSKSETEKRNIEKNIETLKTKLDGYKYSESREAEKKSGEMERLQSEIACQQNRSETFKLEKITKEQALTNVLLSLHGLRLMANPLALPENDPEKILCSIFKEVETIMRKYEKSRTISKVGEEIEPLEVIEEHLPAPYSGLIRRTPLPQVMGSPSPVPQTGSEDEDEVPSRGFLKRQAQLVIDAKSRRRNLRVQLPKRI